MKTINYLYKRMMDLFLRSISIILLLLMFITLTDCSSDDEDTWQIIDDGIVSSWILKSAVFRNQVDLDGPGNMQPTTDAKSLIYDIFDMYGSCGSIDDLPFQFTTEPPLNPDLIFLFGASAHSVNAVCPDGQGVTSWVCDYLFLDNSGTSFQPSINLYRLDIIDPGQLLDWQGGISLVIESSEIIDGKYTISGSTGVPNTLISSLPEPKPDLAFDFVMERVDPHQ